MRRALEARFGPAGGVRRYIRVLQLLADDPLARVKAALRQARLDGERDAEAIRTRVEHAGPDIPTSSFESKPAAAITVPRPDLSQFNHLLPQSWD